MNIIALDALELKYSYLLFNKFATILLEHNNRITITGTSWKEQQLLELSN